MGIHLNNFENVFPFFGLITNQSEWTHMLLGNLIGADFTT